MQAICAGILFGGRSPEYPISLRSAAAVLSALPHHVQPIPIGITRRGEWYRYHGDIRRIAADTWWQDPALLSPLSVSLDHRGVLQTPAGPLSPDVILPVLHGKHGEDGEAQALLACCGIPCVGCDIASGATCLCKVSTKERLACHGIPMARFLSFSPHELQQPAAAIAHAEASLGYPMFVKPSAGGSSLGSGMACCRNELAVCLQNALAATDAQRDRILVEEYISGIEVEVAILEDSNTRIISRPGEILRESSFYDYQSKYGHSAASLRIPAKLNPSTCDICRLYAERIFTALNCRHLARIDFFVTESTGKVLFNEINTFPGFTETSMYPRLLADAGYPLPTLLTTLLQAGMEEGV